MEKVVGNCGKHPGQSMINCPLCDIEAAKKVFEVTYHAVEYCGQWHIQSGAFYGDKNILDAEDVGLEQAEQNAKKIVDFLNSTQP